MNKVQLILAILKLKAKAFGFSSKELQEVAELLSESVTIADDATEEDTTIAVEKAVNMVLPILSMGQKQGNRILERYKQAHPEKKEDGEGEKETKKEEPKDDSELAKLRAEISSMRKSYDESLKTLQNQAKEIKADKVKAERLKKLEALVKDSGKIGESVIKNYNRMAFDADDDTDFEEFLTETKEQLGAINQELADNGLKNLGKPATGKGEKKEEAFSDDEIDSLADGMV